MRIRLKRATTTSTATAKNRKDSFLSLSSLSSDTSVTPATAPGEGVPSYGLDVSNYQQQLELVGRTKRWRSRHDLLLY